MGALLASFGCCRCLSEKRLAKLDCPAAPQLKRRTMQFTVRAGQ
jgi:hypothetical protein